MADIHQYSLIEAIRNVRFLILTHLLYPKARLIRFPFYVRGRDHLSFGRGFTTGYSCRFDLAGEGFSLVIGNNCRINDRVHIVAHSLVEIGDDVLIASNVLISDTNHGSYSGPDPDSPEVPPVERQLTVKPISIGERVWIGENTSILAGANIGAGTVIGANSVVTGSLPSNTICVGSPARPIKIWDPILRNWVPFRTL